MFFFLTWQQLFSEWYPKQERKNQNKDKMYLCLSYELVLVSLSFAFCLFAWFNKINWLKLYIINPGIPADLQCFPIPSEDWYIAWPTLISLVSYIYSISICSFVIFQIDDLTPIFCFGFTTKMRFVWLAAERRASTPHKLRLSKAKQIAPWKTERVFLIMLISK